MGSWTIDGECLSVALVVISLHQRELDLRIVELFDVVTTRLDCGDLLDSNDLYSERQISVNNAFFLSNVNKIYLD